MPAFYIDVENSAGVKQGGGPITSASGWRYTARMDKAGVFQFSMPASDPKAASILKKYIVRAYAYLDGAYVEVGAGIIDRIEKQVQNDGTVRLLVAGDDLIRELTYRSVHTLKLESGGNPISHAAAVALVDAVLTTPLDGWVFTPDASPPNDSIYGYFNGETVLQAAIKVAEKSQSHFYRGEGRSLIFDSEFSLSSQRAIQARGELSAFNCAITKLTQKIDTYDLITRIYPRGSGNANVQLTLRATDRVAPAGYTLDTLNNYIEYNQGTTDYGRIERQVDFRDIGPISNTNLDVIAASNALYDASLEYLRRHSSELEQATYTVQLSGCRTLLRPMQSIRVVYKDSLADLDIDADLNILEATIEVSDDEIYTTNMVVSNADRWPKTDVGVVVDGIAEGHIYQALQQLSANSYVTAYNKNIDGDHDATFRFRFGNEVTQLQQVLFEFQLLEFESTVRSIGGASSGSGDIPTTEPSVDETGQNNDNSGTATGDTGTATGNTGAASGNTGEAEGGDLEGDGSHVHYLPVLDETVGGGDFPMYARAVSGRPVLNIPGISTGETSMITSAQADHTHGLNSHTHSMNNHVHSLNNHVHSLNNHIHTLNNHIHDISEAIVAVYGVFRESAANTYEIDNLQYNVNGLGWEELSDAVDVGGGWFALDITDAVQHDTTFRPLQENNELVIRAKSITLLDWIGSANTISADTAVDHGFEVGDIIVITGAPLSDEMVDINTTWEISAKDDDSFLATNNNFPTGVGDGTGGSVTTYKTVTVDAQLSVRSVIQAILFES